MKKNHKTYKCEKKTAENIHTGWRRKNLKVDEKNI